MQPCPGAVAERLGDDAPGAQAEGRGLPGKITAVREPP